MSKRKGRPEPSVFTAYTYRLSRVMMVDGVRHTVEEIIVVRRELPPTFKFIGHTWRTQRLKAVKQDPKGVGHVLAPWSDT